MKKGIILAFMTAVVSGWAVFINKFALANWSNPQIYTTQKNIVAAAVLTVFVLGFIHGRKILSLTKAQWSKLLIIGLVGGSIPFVLFFEGLKLASSSQAAFWNKTLFVWVAVFAFWILKEKISNIQFMALGLLIFGNLALFYPFKLSFGSAEILILSATLIWALEYSLAKKFMIDIPTQVMAWGRMFFGSIALIVYLLVIGKAGGIFQISIVQIPWLLTVGVTLFLYVSFWYAALKRIPAVLAASILTVASPITTLFNNLARGYALPNNFLWIMVIVLLGLVLLISSNTQKTYANFSQQKN